MSDYRIFRFYRAIFLFALTCLWFGAVYCLWHQAFYKMAPEPVRVSSRDKQARTFLDSATYTLFYLDDGELKPINTSRAEYLRLREGDAVCYSYNSVFGHKFNFQQRPCWQTDSYSPILKLLDLFEGI